MSESANNAMSFSGISLVQTRARVQDEVLPRYKITGEFTIDSKLYQSPYARFIADKQITLEGKTQIQPDGSLYTRQLKARIPGLGNKNIILSGYAHPQMQTFSLDIQSRDKKMPDLLIRGEHGRANEEFEFKIMAYEGRLFDSLSLFNVPVVNENESYVGPKLNKIEIGRGVLHLESYTPIRLRDLFWS